MCYHVSIPERKQIDELFDNAVRTDEWDNFYHHLSGFEFKKVPVLTCEDHKRIQTFNWGLIPSWIKTEEEAKKCVEAFLTEQFEGGRHADRIKKIDC